MTLQGTVVNGNIILDRPQPLPDGTRVTVELRQEPAAAEDAKPTLLSLLDLAGTAPNLPADGRKRRNAFG